jgi:hypothetical protein
LKTLVNAKAIVEPVLIVASILLEPEDTVIVAVLRSDDILHLSEDAKLLFPRH